MYFSSLYSLYIVKYKSNNKTKSNTTFKRIRFKMLLKLFQYCAFLININVSNI